MEAKILYDPQKPTERTVTHDFTLKENRDFLRDMVGTEDAIREELEKIPEDHRKTLAVMFNVYFNRMKEYLLDPYISVLQRETATNAATLEAVKNNVREHSNDTKMGTE